MSILKPHHPSLPHDPRVLLKTPRYCEVKKFGSGGEYSHLGLKNGLIRSLKYSPTAITENILDLQFNVDGIPLFKSSNLSLWPILCLIKNIKEQKPFVVGLFCGVDKPATASEFLKDFIDEYLFLKESGLLIDDRQFKIRMHSFVCDAPARAFLKCIKSHSGYYACEKCSQQGEYLGKVIFPSSDASLRTDQSFAQMDQEEHHIALSPLVSINMGMVTEFCLDYMHLVCLGVVRRLILYWKGPVGPKQVRLGRLSLLELSNRLISCKKYVPYDFARKPRTLQEVLRWKATEFRQFLLYTGVIVLKDILSENLFNNFLLLSVAIRILADPSLAVTHCNYANDLLIAFVADAQQLYGREILVYNVHNLIHLAADVKKFGCLDNFSCFPFENKLGELKKLIRKPQSPIQQLVRRLSEGDFCTPTALHTETDTEYDLRSEHQCGPIPDAGFDTARQYKKVTKDKCIYSISEGNNCFVTEDGNPHLICNILLQNGKIFLLCTKFLDCGDAFNYPLPSSQNGIMRAKKLSKQCVVVPLSNAFRKCIYFPGDYFSKERANIVTYLIIPLLHQ